MKAKTLILAATAASLVMGGALSANVRKVDSIVPAVEATFQPSEAMAPIFAAYRRTLETHCDGHADVMEVYDRLVAAVGRDGGFQPGNARYWPLMHAVSFAAEKHEGQVRKDPEQTPYIVHPLGVALILWEEGGVRDLDTLIAAVLHDTVEDTDTTLGDIHNAFWPGVVTLVREVTDDKSLPREEQKAQQIASAPTKSRGAQRIKLADKLYNLRDLNAAVPGSILGGKFVAWSQEKLDDYHNFSEAVAQGCAGSNADLEKAIAQVIADHRGICLVAKE